MLTCCLLQFHSHIIFGICVCVVCSIAVYICAMCNVHTIDVCHWLLHQCRCIPNARILTQIAVCTTKRHAASAHTIYKTFLTVWYCLHDSVCIYRPQRAISHRQYRRITIWICHIRHCWFHNPQQQPFEITNFRCCSFTAPLPNAGILYSQMVMMHELVECVAGVACLLNQKWINGQLDTNREIHSMHWTHAFGVILSHRCIVLKSGCCT